MISLRKNWNGTENGEAEAPRDALQQNTDRIESVPSREPWVYPSSARLIDANILRHASAVQRKKRTLPHADYRKLVALEFEAKKLNLCRPPTGARSLLEQESQPHERALCLGENDNVTEARLALSNPEAVAFPEAHRPIVLVVDQRMSMHFGSGRDLKSVIAVRIAALVAWRMLASRKPMGMIVFNDKRMSQLGLGCNRLHTLLTLQSLVNQNHDLLPDAGLCSNPRMLNAALRSVKKLAADPLIFLITDARGRDEETFRLATNISQTGNLVTVLIYDPHQMRSLGFARRRRFEQCFFPEGVPVVTINTRGDLMRQLRRSLTSSALRAFAAVRAQRANDSSTLPTP